MTGRAALAGDGGVALVDAAADAFVWGYPLVAVHRARAGHPRGVGGMVAREWLSTAADRSVVAPNNDTLYSSGWFDLDAGDVVVDVDPMDGPDRYWSVMLLDAYTNVSYVCRRLHGTGGATVRVRCDPSRPPADTRRDVVATATPTLWVLARVLVAGPDDLARARAALSRIRVRQPGRRSGSPSSVPAGAPGIAARVGEPDGEFFHALRDALAVDPPAPWHPRCRPLPPPCWPTCRPRACSPSAPGGERPAYAPMTGASTALATAGAPGRAAPPSATTSPTGRRSPSSASPATCRPRTARTAGSSTAPAPRHCGSRSGESRRSTASGRSACTARTCSSSTTRSGGSASATARRGCAEDGSLTLAIGRDRPGDTANWLPAPAGPCVLVLRAYEGHRGVVDATWFPPDLTDATGRRPGDEHCGRPPGAARWPMSTWRPRPTWPATRSW